MMRFLHNRDGHTGIEYSMIAAFIAIGIVTAVSSIGIKVEDLFEALVPALSAPEP